ncbi:MAG: hypothetical protein CBB67_005295 [Alteromonadaceae bacterium TMED7]|nr:hypothetical protein [Alteromonas sp.]RPH20689.1 MAG: hypothetical protein CBB67_005295 [Alteromonadaceae bacterium TMED7]|tara:strand:- start:26515 stop:27336 length:822 start_codon:yes stop_codon:yes gene_type:complete
MGIEQNQSSVTKRRQFIKKAGAGVAVSSLPMKSVWGACSVSGVMSGNLSQTGGGTGDTCGTVQMPNGGRSPGSWFQGNTWTPGSNGDAPASVFPQLHVGIQSGDNCLLDTRIEEMRTIINQFIVSTHLTLPEAAAKYIFDSDTYYSTSVSLTDAIFGTGSPVPLDSRKSILRHSATVYMNVYFGLYNGVSMPLNHSAAMETAEIVMAALIQLKQTSDTDMSDAQLGYTDGHSQIIQSTFESEFDEVFSAACSTSSSGSNGNSGNNGNNGNSRR